jgi:hypothetical protein
MHRIILAFAVLQLAPGCALLDEEQCRADGDQWTWRGEYDAVQGDQPWIEAYARTCQRHGIEVDRVAYVKGWDVGHAEFKRRVNVGL